ncbi:MAG: fatty acid desaturase [Bdellovibrionales bacterium]|nr:fatty acid desaturase [Bdellovibrionales bacterium]
MNSSVFQSLSHSIKKLDWVSTLFLTLTPIATVGFGIYYFRTETFNPWFILLFTFFYYATGMSITGGYHRLFAHKSYEANTAVKMFYLLFGGAAFQNSVKKWASDHRIHHRYVDTNDDPYSINKGFWYAHLFWMFLKEEDQSKEGLRKTYSRDLDKDPLIAWQHKYYVPLAIGMGFVLPALIGAAMGSWVGGLFFGGLLRMVIVHHFTFFINSLCHFWGFQPYTDTNTARDNGLLAVFTYGEGYHNFHHLFHADYRNGIRWYHFDPTKWMIKAFALLTLAKNLKKVPDYEIFRAKMIMKEKRLAAKAQNHLTFVESTLAHFKVKADEAHLRLDKLRAEYQQLRESFDNSYAEKLANIKKEMALAKREFNYCCQQWRLCLSY